MLCAAALLTALEIVLNRFCSINTSGLKIGFSFVPMVPCAMLMGPWWGAAAYALADFIGAILFPIGPYFPGFTVMAAASGMTYGLLLGKSAQRRFFPNTLCAVLIVCVVIGLFVNTFWVSLLYGSKTYWGWFMYRLTTQYAVMIPVQCVLIPVVKRLCEILEKAGVLPGEKRRRA